MNASIAYTNGVSSKSIQIEQSSDESDDEFLVRVSKVIDFFEHGKVVEHG